MGPQMLAVGCHTGALLVYDLTRLQVLKKFTVFNNPVVGIEWCNRHSIIIWSHTQANSASTFQSHDALSSGSQSQNRQTLVKNEIILIDIRTGLCQ